jgi:hypothetical protein
MFDRTQGSLVEDIVCFLTGPVAGIEVPNIALDESERRPLARLDRSLYVVEIAPGTRGEVIQTYNALIEFEQRLQEIRANKPGDSGDEPGLRRGFQVLNFWMHSFAS